MATTISFSARDTATIAAAGHQIHWSAPRCCAPPPARLEWIETPIPTTVDASAITSAFGQAHADVARPRGEVRVGKSHEELPAAIQPAIDPCPVHLDRVQRQNQVEDRADDQGPPECQVTLQMAAFSKVARGERQGPRSSCGFLVFIHRLHGFSPVFLAVNPCKNLWRSGRRVLHQKRRRPFPSQPHG